MLSKSKIIPFIKKFYLDGVNDKVIIHSDGKKNFVKNMVEGEIITEVSTKNVQLASDEDFVIIDVKMLLDYLNLLPEEIEYEFITEKEGKKERLAILQFSGNNKKTNMRLGDINIIPEPKPLKAKFQTDVTFEIDGDLKSSLLNSIRVAETKVLNFVCVKNTFKIVIGDMDSLSSTIMLDVEAEIITKSNEERRIRFNPDLIRNILNVNEQVTMSIDYRGGAMLESNEEDIKCKYLMNKLKDLKSE